MPVALGGVFFFAVVLAIAALSGRKTPQAGESAPAYIFALSTIGLAFVLYLGYASFFILHAVCILCVTTYVAIIAHLHHFRRSDLRSHDLSAGARAGRDLKTLVRQPRGAAPWRRCWLVGAVSVNAAFPKEAAAEQAAAQAPADFPPLTDQQKAEVEKWWDMQPKVDVPVPTDGAKVLMVKFNDYQCPPCRQTYRGLYGPDRQVDQDRPVQVRAEALPARRRVQRRRAGGPHPAACEAAAAVVMARRKNDGSAEKLEHWLFAHQGPPLLTPDEVKAAAKDVAGIPDFDAKYAATLVEVKNDAGMGVMLGVKSTPTFFINGRMLPGGQDPRLIDALIDLEMKRGQMMLARMRRASACRQPSGSTSSPRTTRSASGASGPTARSIGCP